MNFWKFSLLVLSFFSTAQVSAEVRDMTPAEMNMICERFPDKCPKKDTKPSSFQVIGVSGETKEMSLIDPEIYQIKEHLVFGYSVSVETQSDNVLALAIFPSKHSREMLSTKCYFGQIRKICFSELYLHKSRKFKEFPSKIEVTLLNRSNAYKADWPFSDKAKEILRPFIEQ